MMKLTCFCVLALFVGVLADTHEVACCPPGLYISLRKVEGKAICFAPWRNESELAILQCDTDVLALEYSNFTIKEDGTAKLIIGTESINITNSYCVNEMITIDNTTIKFGFVCNESKLKEVQIHGYIMMVSVLFLIITVIIYAVLKELRDLLGISYLNLCGSLAIGLCLLATIILTAEKESDQALCAVRGFLTYFFLLVSFFWTTAISTQVLISIRTPGYVTGSKWKFFGWYALFAWGCPLLLTISMVIVNYHPGNHPKPGIGVDTCWFESEKNDIWYWLYSVLAILTTANIVMFAYVSYFLCRNTFASNRADVIKYKFFMALKLFVVMGIFWIIELIMSLHDSYNVFWRILNILTCLQGLWIFLVIVVFRKRVIRALHKRGWLACISGPVEKHLANGGDVDDEIIEHTSVPMNDR